MTHNVFIGWDSRELEAYEVAEHSIATRSPSAVCSPVMPDIPYLTRAVERQDGKLWCPISQAPMATEFAISRFCVPFMFKNHGWALFVDCDIVCLTDIAELFALADTRYAVMCVKHQQEPHPYDRVECWLECGCSGGWIRRDVADASAMRCEKHSPPSNTKLFNVVRIGNILESLKMDGQYQTVYPCKNWSSVVLWNCDHPAHDRFTLEHLNTWPGRDLHAFKWLDDSEIGELPPNWNYLVDVNLRPDPIKIAHFTLGGPWLPNWKGGSCDDIWEAERQAMG